MSRLIKLTELLVSCCNLGEEGVRCVGRLTGLHVLNAANLTGAAGSAAVRWLSALTQLTYLNIGGSPISTADACHVLRQLTHLRGLRVAYKDVGGDVADVLAQHVTSLQFLDVSLNDLGDGGVAQLSALTRLRVLGMACNSVTDDSTLPTSLVQQLLMLKELRL